MNFDGNFRSIGNADISDIRDLVLRLTPEQWNADAKRQERYEVHKETQTINLVYDYDFRHVNPTKHPALEVFGGAIKPLLIKISEYYDNTPEGLALVNEFGQGYCIRVNLVKLSPNGEIAAHTDKNFSLAHSHRIHVPIVTNPDVHFTIGDEVIFMDEGEIVEINNRREHSVINKSADERVHLIFDWIIAGESCCCSHKVHPGIECNPEVCLETDRLKTACECHPIH